MEKILFIAPNLKSGGAEKVLVKILNNINQNKYNIKLILLDKTGSLLNSLNTSIEVVDLESENSIYSLYKLYSILKNEKPEVVFSIIGHVNVILAMFKFIVFKDIVFIGRENVVYSEWLYKNKDFKKIILNILYKIFLKRLDVVIVQSEYMKNEIIKYFKVPLNKIKVLNNPIEKEKIDILKKEKINEITWDSNKKNLLAVGRIEEVKNYKDMIDIISLLPDTFHLSILGEGSQTQELIDYIKLKNIENSVTLYGFVDNPYKFMASSIGLLLTSQRESFPNVVLEANACGTYVFSYKMPGGITEIINEKSTNGSLITYGNKIEMVNKIENQCLEEHSNKMIEEYSEKYNIQDYINNILEIFDTNIN